MSATCSDTALALEVRNLTVRFGGFTAVDNVDFEVPAGSIVGLIGPNGAGKSSCFLAIGGDVRPKSGTVTVGGRALVRNNPRAAWRAGISRTYQRPELFWTLTVHDHFHLAARKAKGLGRTTVEPEEILAMLGLETLRDTVVGTLPLGTTRLVELGRAIASAPSLVLMDEPCSGLDHEETAEMAHFVQSIRDRFGLSILIVEHDMDFILTIAHNLFVLNYGKLIATGSPAEIRASPVVRSAYLGDSN